MPRTRQKAFKDGSFGPEHVVADAPQLEVNIQDGKGVDLVRPDGPEVAEFVCDPTPSRVCILLQDAVKFRAVHPWPNPYAQVITCCVLSPDAPLQGVLRWYFVAHGRRPLDGRAG